MSTLLYETFHSNPIITIITYVEENTNPNITFLNDQLYKVSCIQRFVHDLTICHNEVIFPNSLL